MKKIIWMGPIVPDLNLSDPAVSPAANYWQKSFVNSLKSNSYDIDILSYLPDRSWPIGKFWVKKIELKELDQFTSSGYINIIVLREIFIPLSLVSLYLFKNFRKLYKQRLFLFIYNTELKHRIAAKILRKFLPVNVVAIIADHKRIGNYFANLFLSFDYFKRSTSKNSFFFEGGIDLIPDNKVDRVSRNDKSLNMLFVGMLSDHSGIFSFIEKCGEHLKEENVILNICGSGDVNRLNKFIISNPNIRYLGFLSEPELVKQCHKIDFFLNPRPIHGNYNENNFPSKVLYYLRFKKPILSSKAKGFSPEYEKVVEFYDIDDSSTFISGVKEIRKLVTSSKFQYHLNNFIQQNSWDIKTKNLIQRLEESF